jgi:hypothetical protein
MRTTFRKSAKRIHTSGDGDIGHQVEIQTKLEVDLRSYKILRLDRLWVSSNSGAPRKWLRIRLSCSLLANAAIESRNQLFASMKN